MRGDAGGQALSRHRAQAEGREDAPREMKAEGPEVALKVQLMDPSRDAGPDKMAVFAIGPDTTRHRGVRGVVHPEDNCVMGVLSRWR